MTFQSSKLRGQFWLLLILSLALARIRFCFIKLELSLKNIEFMCMDPGVVCMSVHHVCIEAYGCQKTDPLELELLWL